MAVKTYRVGNIVTDDPTLIRTLVIDRTIVTVTLNQFQSMSLQGGATYQVPVGKIFYAGLIIQTPQGATSGVGIGSTTAAAANTASPTGYIGFGTNFGPSSQVTYTMPLMYQWAQNLYVTVKALVTATPDIIIMGIEV